MTKPSMEETTREVAGKPRISVTLVHAPACHFCKDAEIALADLAVTYRLIVDRVDVRSPEGMRLVQIHRAPMSPLVLVDGAFFSAGRLPRRKLMKLLEQRRVAGREG